MNRWKQLALLLVAASFIPAGNAAAQRPETAAQVPAQPVVEPTTLLVRIVKRGKFIGYPAVCPGSSPDEDQSQIICMAELYEARVRVLRHLGGPKTARFLTIRFTAHSFSAVWRSDVRFLLVVTPFEDKGSTGHFAHRWEWEDKDGMFCMNRDDVDEEEWLSIKRLYVGKTLRKVTQDDDRWSEGAVVACATGMER